jgi:hypothetical protein
MKDFPHKTFFNRSVPKKSFTTRGRLTSALKRAFTADIERITWRNKLSPSTLALQTGQQVAEIQVFELVLKNPSFNSQILHIIERQLHYHALFLLRHGNRYRASISYQSGAKQTILNFISTSWMPFAELPLQIIGPTMDDVYANFLRQIHPNFNACDELSLDETMKALAWQQRCDKEIASLEKRLRAEKQPKQKLELKQQLTTLKNSSGDFHGQDDHAHALRRGQEY